MRRVSVTEGYRLAATNTWRATPEEERLADPQILAAMPDVAHIAGRVGARAG